MADVIYKKGQSANLDNVEIADGQILVTEDTGEMYIDMSDGTRKKVTDTNKPGLKTAEGGEIFNDYENNQARTPMSSARGEGTVAGGKGFKILGLQPDSKNICPLPDTRDGINDISIRPDKNNGTFSFIISSEYDGSNFISITSFRFNEVGTYTISGDLGCNFFTLVNDPYPVGYVTSEGLTFEVTENDLNNVFIVVFNYGNEYNGMPVSKDDAWIQVEKGSTKTEFEPHYKNYYKLYSIDGTEIDDIKIDDIYSVRIGNNYDNQGIIESIDKDNNTVTVTNFTKGTTTTLTNAYLWLPVMSEDWSTYDDPETKTSLKATRKINAGTTYMDAAQYAEGSETYAIKYAAHAEGNRSVAAGDSSHAEGNSTKAYGNISHAEGYLTKAEGEMSHAEGYNTRANGDSSHTEGYLAEAVGDGAHAEGHKTLAQGDFSHAQGNQTQALGSGSAAAGYKTTAGYDMQFVIGRVNDNKQSNLFEIGNGLPYYRDGNTNTGEVIDEKSFKFSSFEVDTDGVAKSESFATKSTILNRDTFNIYDEGNPPIIIPGSIALGLQSVAFGQSAEASGDASFAQGIGVKATETNQAVFGKYNAEDKDALFIVGNGDETSKSNAFQVMASGTIQAPNIQQAPDKVKDGFTFKNKNANAAALDAEVKKWNDGTELVPYGAKPGKFATAFGGKSAAIGKRSLAEGTTTIAKGDYSHAEGDNSVALGGASHAEGTQTVTGPDAYGAHAEGGGTQAKGNYSHAEGYLTVAQGSDSHAEGDNTVATGHASHAGGQYSNAAQKGAFAHGNHVIASAENQTVFGKYNEEDTNALFIVGNGTSENDRNNAFVVKNNGTGLLNNKPIATEEYVDKNVNKSLVFDTKAKLDSWIYETPCGKNLLNPWDYDKDKILTQGYVSRDGHIVLNYNTVIDPDSEDLIFTHNRYVYNLNLEAGIYTIFIIYGSQYIYTVYSKFSINNVEYDLLESTEKEYSYFTKTFELTENSDIELQLENTRPATSINCWVQLEKGSTPTEYETYIPPYVREDDHLTKNDLNIGDLLLVEEENVPDYYWNGNEIVKLEAFLPTNMATTDITNELSERINTLTSNGLTRSIVSSLPESANAKENVIYMIPNEDSSENNIYDEYMFFANSEGTLIPEKIGSTTVDLSNYYTSEEVDSKLSLKADSDHNHDDTYATEDYVDEHITNILAEARESGEFNGTDGQDGYTPIKGVDYYTDKEKVEFETYISTELAKRGQLKPEFAESIKECTDTSKLYVLPDGFIYAYMKSETNINGSINQITISTDAEGNIYNGTGYKDGYRFNSSNQEATLTGVFITGFIPVKVGDTIYLNGNYMDAEYSNAGSLGHMFYKSDKTTILARVDMLKAESTGYGYSSFEVNSDGYVTSFTLRETWDYVSDWEEVAYVRLNLIGNGEGCVVTVNEPIVEETTEVTQAWTNTGHAFVPADYEDRIFSVEESTTQNAKDIEENTASIAELKTEINNIRATDIPEYWQEHLDSKIARIKSLHKQYGKDCFSFVFMTDTHYPSNLGKISPLLVKHIMNKANIKYALHAGDWQTRGCHTTKEALLTENENIEKMFEPIIDRLLWQQGNHDGAYGLLDRDGNGKYNNSDSNGNVYSPNERESYIHNLTPQELHEFAYRKVGMVGNVHFDDTGTAYYIDDISNNVRYIGLNTQCNDYELQTDGTQKYPKMWIAQFMQSQFDFLIDEALVENVTDKTKIVIFAHVPPTTKEIRGEDLINGVLNAFVNRLEYTKSYEGEDGYGAVSVDAKFTNAKGTLVGYFHGHTHKDSVDRSKGFNIIGTRCDAQEENDATLNAERVTGTITEQSFDVFTVTSDGIYATKIGAGTDREIELI